MKISAAVREAYAAQRQVNVLVEKDVRAIVDGRFPETWHFEGRLKEEESFALKLETGRFDPAGLEDFFACTVVVPTLSELDDAERRIGDLFEVQVRRPLRDDVAMHPSRAFPFDHIRLYARLRLPPGVEEGPKFRSTFEIQVKTYLQHAWSIATHDLVYKTAAPNWGYERIASQAKAVLEATEVAIVEAEALAATGNRYLAKSDREITELLAIIDVLNAEFEGALPKDLRRLAVSVREMLRSCHCSTNELKELLEQGRAERGGKHPSNLSPLLVITQYLIDKRSNKLKRALTQVKGRDFLFVPELEIPETLTVKDYPRAKLVGSWR